MSKTPNFELRILTYPEDGDWLAHCLELDIVAEGKTPDQAAKDLIDLCILQIQTAIEENDLLSIIHPAPAPIWKMFFEAKKRKRRRPRAKGPILEFDNRELELV